MVDTNGAFAYGPRGLFSVMYFLNATVDNAFKLCLQTERVRRYDQRRFKNKFVGFQSL